MTSSLDAYDRGLDALSIVRGLRDIAMVGGLNLNGDNDDASFVVKESLERAEECLKMTLAYLESNGEEEGEEDSGDG